MHVCFRYFAPGQLVASNTLVMGKYLNNFRYFAPGQLLRLFGRLVLLSEERVVSWLCAHLFPRVMGKRGSEVALLKRPASKRSSTQGETSSTAAPATCCDHVMFPMFKPP